MSQTEGQHFDYLNSNRETISAHFEDVKKALERTAKEYQFKYEDIENKSNIDRENKIITIRLILNIFIFELIFFCCSFKSLFDIFKVC